MNNHKEGRKRKILMLITGILIAVSGIIFKQTFFKMLPLFVSLVVTYLYSKVDRRAQLLGGLNSILYTIVYAMYHLYATAGYALLVSFPLQTVGYLRWNKKAYKDSTELRQLTAKQKICLSGAFAAAWLVLYQILNAIGSSYLVWDNTVSLIGLVCSLLTIFAFVEYTWLQIVGNVFNLVLYMTMLKENPEQITYVIFAIYAIIGSVIGFINSRKLYTEQNVE